MIEIHQLALPIHRQLCTPVDHLRPLGPGKRPSACVKKSRSTVSSSILACSSWSFSRPASRSVVVPPDTSAARCYNSLFLLVIWLACISYCLILLGQLGDGFLALERFKCYPGLECRGMVSSWSSHCALDLLLPFRNVQQFNPLIALSEKAQPSLISRLCQPSPEARQVTVGELLGKEAYVPTTL